jgi:hypothetical protein
MYRQQGPLIKYWAAQRLATYVYRHSRPDELLARQHRWRNQLGNERNLESHLHTLLHFVFDHREHDPGIDT